jgi:membrane-bound metal-dependent hydrolase YbcI (DUF457 family)
MPQAGLHALVGASVRKWVPAKEWLLLGILLGNFLPDMDNLLVAVATVAKWTTSAEALEVYHRTFTHSVFTVLFIWIAFWLIGRARRQPKWTNLGWGLGIGVTMHILLDFVIWFNGVHLFWPLGNELNFWVGVIPPAWLDDFLNPAEFLCFALFLYLLRHFAVKHQTDADFMQALNIWLGLMVLLFLVFTPLFYIETPPLMFTVYGAFYLLALCTTFGITIRMRATVARLG